MNAVIPDNGNRELKKMMTEANQTAREKGWWDTDRGDESPILLMICELAEATESLRKGNPPSDHIPEFSGLEEELADTIIRILDFSAERGLRLPEAISAKMAYNKTRSYRHGNKKF